MKILAFGASSSKHSINKALATMAAKLYQTDVNTSADIEILDLNDFEMPIYSIDREKADGIPTAAHTFLNKIGDADALIISFASHNGSYSAAYKNIFDWASRIDAKVFQNKAMLLLATSPGKGGAKSVLTAAIESAPHFNADVKASLSVPSFHDAYDEATGTFNSDALMQNLLAAVQTLSKAN